MPEITGNPGYRSDRNATYRRIRKSDQGAQWLEGGIPIDGTYSGDAGNTGNVDVLRPGKIMVKKNSGGLYRNFIIGKSTAAYVDNDTTITVGAATATEVARLIAAAGASLSLAFIGPPTAAGTVAATAITVTAASGTTLADVLTQNPGWEQDTTTIGKVIAGAAADGSDAQTAVGADAVTIDITNLPGDTIKLSSGWAPYSGSFQNGPQPAGVFPIVTGMGSSATASTGPINPDTQVDLDVRQATYYYFRLVKTS